MRKRPLVLLLGDSLIMDSVAGSIARSDMLDFKRIDFISQGDSIESIKPEYIMFELDTPQTNDILALLSRLPGTLLLGIDLNCSRVFVMNSQEYITRSMKDLNHLLEIESGLRMEIG